jgi:hypothetical protein
VKAFNKFVVDHASTLKRLQRRGRQRPPSVT